MRAAPLSAALLLLAPLARACPFGPPGHSHVAALEPSLSGRPLPEGRCSGRAKAPATPSLAGPELDLKAHPLEPGQATYYALIGYTMDAAAARMRDPSGAVVTEPAWRHLHRTFDASYEKLQPEVWATFLMNGYRMDERTCRLETPGQPPVMHAQILIWAALTKQSQSFSALEELLARLRGLPADAPIPADLRRIMAQMTAAGAELPPRVKSLLARNSTKVGQLRAPAEASYAEQTAYFDGQRPVESFRVATFPGAGPEAAARRKPVTDPVEAELGRTLQSGFEDALSKTKPGRDLLARFDPKKGGLPPVLVLKLTQSPNDPRGAHAMYVPESDRMVLNHWRVVRLIVDHVPKDKLERIKGRLEDPRQLNALLKEDPSLLALVVDQLDVEYFHELTHAAQARRNRYDDEAVRGNLPGVNPLSKEHEAHRMHCVYLFSKPPAAVARNEMRDACLELLRDPEAFKDAITANYLSTSGGATLEDVRSRQQVRRAAVDEGLKSGDIFRWARSHFKSQALTLGDAELDRYEEQVARDEKAFLGTVPGMRVDVGGRMIAYWRATNRPDLALGLMMKLPPKTFGGAAALEDQLADESLRWYRRHDESKEGRDDRIAALNAINAVYSRQRRPLPEDIVRTYRGDAASLGEELFGKAMETRLDRRRPDGPLSRVFVITDDSQRRRLLEAARSWAEAGGDAALVARIDKARGGGK